ncbi:MAG: AsnC family transcriptional regulator [Desulfobulbus propionicus]|nr:MAG: AsnC family transcriptional regulator [Desulfobulbus propionicus]
MIDDTSLKILKILQEKARIPNVEVARKMEMAPSAVLERIRKLERNGIIDGYEVRLNPDKVNRRLVAFIQVYVQEAPSTHGLGDIFAGLKEVQEVHYVAGHDCYLLKLRIADTDELGRILREKIMPVPEVTSTRTLPVLQTYKETSKLPLDSF